MIDIVVRKIMLYIFQRVLKSRNDLVAEAACAVLLISLTHSQRDVAVERSQKHTLRSQVCIIQITALQKQIVFVFFFSPFGLFSLKPPSCV